MARVTLGVFSDRNNAENALKELESEGFDTKQISVLTRSTEETEQVVANTNATPVDNAASGAVTGGIIGGLTGLLAGIGALTIPGLGAILIGGPIAAALGLTGATAATVSGAVTGALAGGLIGALVDLGVPESSARIYEDEITRGGVLLAVPTRVEDHREEEILRNNGAKEIQVVEV